VLGDNDLVRDGDYCTGADSSLCAPHGTIGFDRDGKIFVPDLDTQRVKKFPSAAPIGGTIVSASGMMFDLPGRNSNTYANHVGASGLANPGFVAFVGTQMSWPTAGASCSGTLHQHGHVLGRQRERRSGSGRSEQPRGELGQRGR